MQPIPDREIGLYSACPSLNKMDGKSYLARVIDIARWSEQIGCNGTLVYADNSQVDPWTVAHAIIQHTNRLCPLIAVQPVYMHPYQVAKIVASIAHLYGRRVHLNMVAGGFKNDLLALNDTTLHDRRYDRLVEYTQIIKQLLIGDGPLNVDGEYYKVNNLKLLPPVPSGLFPGIFISGSSDAGFAAAQVIGATAIKYPKPLHESRNDRPSADVDCGVRIGILSRERDEEAWEIARQHFPEDHKGQLTRQLATKVSDSVWHKQLSEQADVGGRGAYWMVPFHQYQTNCPYLVGDYESVGQELSGYISLGYRTFILDVPPAAEELKHIRKAFDVAMEVRRAAIA